MYVTAYERVLATPVCGSLGELEVGVSLLPACGFWDQTWVVRLGSKCLYRKSLLDDPVWILDFCNFSCDFLFGLYIIVFDILLS